MRMSEAFLVRTSLTDVDVTVSDEAVIKVELRGKARRQANWADTGVVWI